MAYFIPSYIQKRLLRYALSRLELLDTDALDLEKLDIAFGKRSTVELRDVGLRIEKLASLLHLPERLELSRARVLLLRVTVPADIHRSGILVEIEGVEVRTRLHRVATSKDKRRPSKRHSRSDSTLRSPAGTPKSSKSARASFGHQPQDVDHHIPSTEELAKSFLQEEPEEEKQELEAAILSQTQRLSESTWSNEGDEAAPLGMGTALTLPTFLSNFLKGIADRLQLTIKDLDVRLETELQEEAVADPIPGCNFVALDFHINWVEIEGLTSETPQVEILKDGAKTSDGYDYSLRPGKRRIRLRSVYGRLLSDPVTFAHLTRLSAPASPVETQSGYMSEPSSVSDVPSVATSQSTSTFHSPQVNRSVGSVSKASVASSSQQSPEQTTISTQIGRPPSDISASILTEDGDRFADAGDDDDGTARFDDHGTSASMIVEDISNRNPRTSQGNGSELGSSDDDHGLSESMFQGSFAEQYGEASFDDMESEPSPPRSATEYSTPDVRLSRMGLATTTPGLRKETSTKNGSSQRSPVRSLSQSQPNPDQGTMRVVAPFVDNKAQALDAPVRPPAELSTPRSSSTSGSSEGEDLAQSRMWSHDEAESMYLSAMSEVPASSRHLAAPGAWAGSDDEAEPVSTNVRIPETPLPGTLPALQSRQLNEAEMEDRCDTPRPQLQQSAILSPSRPETSATRSESSSSSPLQKTTQEEGGQLLQSRSLVAKEFFKVDEISVWVPGIQESDSLVPQSYTNASTDRWASRSLAQSHRRDLPGSFSQYAASSSDSRWQNFSSPPPSEQHEQKHISQGPQLAEGIDLDLGPVVASVDESVGRLLFMLIQQLLIAFNAASGVAETNSTTTDNGEGKSSFLAKVRIEAITLRLCERLAILDQLSASAQVPQKESRQSPGQDAVLLVAAMQELGLSMSSLENASNLQLDVGTLTFGYPQDNIVSFDSSASIRTSRRDLRKGKPKDISLNLITKSGRQEIAIDTLPIRVTLDVQRLDDTLSSFGGFSGILELGSSVMSNSTIIAETRPSPRARGVHFESGSPSSQNKNSASQPKLNLRVAGSAVKLIGRSCSMLFRSSALKAISRDNAIGLQVDEMEISGPDTGVVKEVGPLLIGLQNTRVEYVFVPEETDLSRFLSIIMPSKYPYEDDKDIVMSALLRQRKAGSVLRATIGKAQLHVVDLDGLKPIQDLGLELTRLSTVAKYLPEDDRPGILSLISIKELESRVRINDSIGTMTTEGRNIQIAHVGWPPLLAVEIGNISLHQDTEELVHQVADLPPLEQLPMIMLRMVGDDVEPKIRAKLFNVCFEYRIRTVLAFMGLPEDATAEDITTDLAASVATITGKALPASISRQSSNVTTSSRATKAAMNLDVLVKECAIGLNPRELPSKGLFVVGDARLTGEVPEGKDFSTSLELRTASILLVDHVENLTATDNPPSPKMRSPEHINRQISELCAQGYVVISTIKSTHLAVKLHQEEDAPSGTVEVDLLAKLFTLETCADSTQTMINLFNSLAPPSPPSKVQRYKTKVMPIENLMASFAGDFFAKPNAAGAPSPPLQPLPEALHEDDLEEGVDMVGSFYVPDDGETAEDPDTGSFVVQNQAHVSARDRASSRARTDTDEEFLPGDDDFEFFDLDFLGHVEVQERKYLRWDNDNGKLKISNSSAKNPITVSVKVEELLWNLHDGYDWQRTRDVITKAVRDVEAKAEERRRERRPAFEDDEDDESVIGDILFNSIYIGIPAKSDPQELRRQINRNMDDLTSETGSDAPTTISRTTSYASTTRSRGKRLRLERSRKKRIQFDLRGVAVEFVVFPPGSGSTQNSVNILVRDLEVFDNMPTSTWRKFATYNHDYGQRHASQSQVDVTLLTVKLLPDVSATDLILTVKVAPLRLHVDQDALDFITRFFEFKDESAPSQGPTEQPFFSRIEVEPVKLRLDYKPKKVDYAGLRSGHTTEFMNFFILDSADILLKNVILYGTPADKIHDALNNVWMPDVKRNQLPTVLSGLAPVRSLVNIGTGVRDLIYVPMQEYKKDGRVVRSIQKGAIAFAKTTAREVAQLGAKLAVGTQGVLQGAEGLFDASSQSGQAHYDHESSDDDDLPKAHSNYADQPLNVRQGLLSAARYLERDLLTAKNAIIAIPGEIAESGSATGAAKAVAKRAPLIILRPAIGVTKAVGQAAMGVANAVDPEVRRRTAEKYKSY